MILRRRLISVLISALLFATITRADMAPIYLLDSERPESLCVCDRMEARCTDLYSLHYNSIFLGFDFGAVQFPLETSVDIWPPAQLSQLVELTGGPGSARLCLYALMSLGVYRAPHRIKRLNFGRIPEWYHYGRPFQIDYSFTVSLESLHSVPVHSFIQPVWTAESLIPQYHLGVVVSLWRKSQFTPETIASRSPPLFSC